MTDRTTNNKAVGWSDQLDELSLELRGVTEVLGDLAYNLEETKPPYGSITAVLFSACNHIDRIAEDLMRLDKQLDEQKRERLAEAMRTVEKLSPYRDAFRRSEAKY